MKITIKKMEEYQVYLAKAIASRSDGSLYVPLFERIESELTALKAETDTIERIRRLANA